MILNGQPGVAKLNGVGPIVETNQNGKVKFLKLTKNTKWWGYVKHHEDQADKKDVAFQVVNFNMIFARQIAAHN